MEYIKQIGANVVVKTDLKDLPKHPCLETGLFEIVQGEIPKDAEFLNYSE